MMRKLAPVVVIGAATLGLNACGFSKSSNPLSPSVAGPIPGVSITPPTLMQPSNGANFAVAQQPITLTVGNATTSGVRPLTYSFEVAVDVNFTNKIFTRSSITPGTSGQTSLPLPSALATGYTYYWRAQAQDGANTGAFSPASSFSVFTPIVINAPVPVSPINNATVSSLTPALTFTDATRSGPVGTITYAIELALDNAFANRVAVWTLSEQPNQTQFTAPQALAYATQYYWHVRAADPTTSGPWSATVVFQTLAAPVVVAPPPPAPGSGNSGGFDHPWTGNVELQLRALLASGLAGADGLNGQAVVDQMNALGGIYAGGEFQQHHDGPSGFPTYGYPWFYVSFVPMGDGTSIYQIVEFGTPPGGD
jgi:hypothetical protein